METKEKYSAEEVFQNAQSYFEAQEDLDLIVKAYNFAHDLHENQFRKSGEPYIVHPTQVAGILVELEMDPVTVAAGFLHDVVEDTKTTLEELEEKFGSEVMHLVDGVTKLGQLKYDSQEQAQAENHRKMFVAMAQDFRVILIKLADRTHNMRTLKYLDRAKQMRIASETLEIFAPLARRMGISKIQWELEDLCLRYLNADQYYRIVNLMKQKRGEREAYLKDIMDEIRQTLKELGIQAEVTGRPKHIYSIYRKMVKQNRPFDQIYDLIAVRIIVKSIKDCYAALGTVHTMWRPVPGRFKDYIAMPKSNMYQSLHTTVIGPNGIKFEIQIRTEAMHRVAQFGLAAHWAYKEGKDLSPTKGAMRKMDFFKEFIEIQEQEASAVEFMDSLKMDLLADMIYVFTPRGDLFELPKGSVPIDFAYRIHSEVGDKMVGVKINSKIATLDTPLNTGDIVEVLTNKNSAGPSRDWLKIAHSTHTKSKIKQFFKKQSREENIEKGREMLQQEVRDMDITLKEAFTEENINRILERYNFNVLDDLYNAIGYSGLNVAQVATRLTEKIRKQREKEDLEKKTLEKAEELKSFANHRRHDSGVHVPGIDNLLIRLSKCCSPVPGDEIVGFITKGRGVSVHRADCQNVNLEAEKDRLIAVEWEKPIESKEYNVEIEIVGYDRNDLLSDVLAAVSETKTAINSVYGRADHKKGAVITMSIRIAHLSQLEKIFNRIQQVQDIYEVRRVMG